MGIRLLFLLVLVLHNNIAKSSGLDDRLSDMGFVEVSTLGEEVELMYGRPDNFTGAVLYSDLSGAWLHPSAAKALGAAVKALEREAPGYKLLVKDAARPMSVQRKMFDAVKVTSKANYVANPAKGGGLHNYGLAVDITLLDPEGKEVSMGTPVDYLGKESRIDNEEVMVRAGTITADEMKNRRLLRKVMREGGFKTIRNEWWHFQMVSRAVARARYRLLDF